MQRHLAEEALEVGIDLTHPSWVAVGSTHAIGQAFAADRLLRAREIAQRLDVITDRSAWITEIASLNGSFAVVAHQGSEVRGAVDRLRGFPLFYTCDNESLHISDAAARLVRDAEKSRLDPEARMEFEFAGYVTGDETLIPGLRQIRAGHALLGTFGEGARQMRYYAFRHQHFLDEPADALIARLVDVHGRIFRRLLEDVGDRQLVLPLSGGYDSRLIAHSLREFGASNVLCYTYGLPGNWESRISRELAKYLGFDWTMVPYSAEKWRLVAEDAAFSRYFADAANFASLAHIQDWPAVQALVAQRKIAPDAVFVPGHSGDFLAGSHVPKHFANRSEVRREELLQAIFDAHYTLWDWPRDATAPMKRIFTTRIERVIGPMGDGSVEHAADALECWDCEERQAKFIVNSVRAYESFGFEWRLPLFDSELMDYWSRVRVEWRLRRRLYFEFVRRWQRMPITEANTDRGPALRAAVELVATGALRGLATAMRRRLRRFNWRRQYERGDLGWLALVEPHEFRRQYSGRENGHAFFARRYLRGLDDR
jgi:asparagine synthase (glutamine-hydrolysing)